MIVRPGLIAGPYDPTDRFTYWVRRMAEGGEVLAPESPDVAATQIIDASDMARWIIASAVTGRTGTYNAVAPTVRLARVLESARSSDADVVWVPWDFLEAQGTQPWTDLPAWVPAPMLGLLAADGSKAFSHGLVHRDVEDVIRDISAWDRARPQAPLRVGMSRNREAELLRKFRAEGPPHGP
jgi:2'-hydroxyisoflavone reductase